MYNIEKADKSYELITRNTSHYEAIDGFCLGLSQSSTCSYTYLTTEEAITNIKKPDDR